MTAASSGSVSSGRTAIQNAALWIGVVFLLIGIAGFIPGITTNYDQMTFAGPESEALLLGVFQVSILHNIVHLLFGVWGLAAARSFSGSRVYLIGGGLIYGLLWIYGLVVDEGTTANFVPLNDADNWLHLGLFVLMVLLGVVLGSENRRPVAAPNE
jgi:hypothetical protein